MWGVWGVTVPADRKYTGHGASEHEERAVHSREEEWGCVCLWLGVCRRCWRLTEVSGCAQGDWGCWHELWLCRKAFPMV